jgi:hypothetical protein
MKLVGTRQKSRPVASSTRRNPTPARSAAGERQVHAARKRLRDPGEAAVEGREEARLVVALAQQQRAQARA